MLPKPVSSIFGLPRQTRYRCCGVKRKAQAQDVDSERQQGRQTSYYQTLNVAIKASAADIHSAYKRRALATHPDKGGSVVEFQHVQEAFEALSDVAKRRAYDETLSDMTPTCKLGYQSFSCKRRAKKCINTLNDKLSSLLQRMSPGCRREVILRRLDSAQRADLEKHMLSEKAKAGRSKGFIEAELCDSDTRKRAGVHRVARTGRYYARVFVQGFGLQSHARKELTDAIEDNADLMELACKLKLEYFNSQASDRSPPWKLQAALPAGLVASVQLIVYNRHFIGNRPLQLNFKTLTDGLDAWAELQEAKGTTLFRGNGITAAYSPQAAKDQWQRMKSVYLKFASCRHGSRAQLAEELRFREKQQLPRRLKRDCTLWQRRQGETAKLAAAKSDVSDGMLVRCVERLLKHHARLTLR